LIFDATYRVQVRPFPGERLVIQALLMDMSRFQARQRGAVLVGLLRYAAVTVRGFAAGLALDDTSAWLVLAMLGLHPIAGSDAWVIGTPHFPRVELDVQGGVLAITRDGGDDDGAVVTLDDERVDGPRLPHARLMAGGTLRFAGGAGR
jgi:hypothetical protein